MIRAVERGTRLDEVEIAVGVQGPGVGQVVEYATANEFGTATIPPRPFLRATLAEQGGRWVRGAEKAVVLQTNGDDAGADRTLRILGVVMVGDVQAKIIAGPWTPNAASTIARKGSDRPLVDSGQLRQSIRASVDGEIIA